MTKNHLTKTNKITRSPLVLLAAMAFGLPLVFNATRDQAPSQASPEQVPESSHSQPLTFFHWDNETVLPGPAEALKFPHLLDPGTKVNFRTRLTLGRGDTLMNLLTGAGIDRREAYEAIEAMSKIMDPRKIKIGQEIYVTLEKPVFNNTKQPVLRQLNLPVEFGQDLVVTRGGERRFQADLKVLEVTPLKMYAAGTITDSLYLAATREGVPVGVITEMIRLFSFDVDFQREIWSGDTFSILYERRLTEEGEAENNGKVLTATLILRGKPLTFYRYERPGGSFDFYTADGKSARKMLMKTPVDGARLSSRYGNRKHPILGYTRMHEGLDFAAPQGTPIMAAGDGVIERSSRYGSYGNYVRIRHNGTYKTAYGHLSAYGKGIRSGVRVKQGQIIGYVGATGGATGPHLHYEILVDNDQINPFSLKLPKGDSLAAADFEIFTVQVADFEAKTTSILAHYNNNFDEMRHLKAAGK